MAQTVTVTGVNDDGEEDGPKPYLITLERAQSRDRFYDGFDPHDVSVTNQDNDPEPEELEPPQMEQSSGDGGGGCALASRAQVKNMPKSGALVLFLSALLLLFAVQWKGLLREG